MADARYLEDASGFRGFASRVFVPDGADETASILAEAVRAETPVTVAGAGTGVTGGRVPQGGWVISTEKLTRIEIDGDTARVGAGVALRDLHAAAERAGRLYPPDPTEWTASVGGTIGANASGSRSFLSGATRRWVRALTVATMDGRSRRYERGEAIGFDVPAIPAPRTTKNTAGYPLRPGMDWVDLFTGSEGTLGAIVEAELRLLPTPGRCFTGLVFFPDDAAAIAAVDTWRPIAGLRMLEYFDGNSLRLLRPGIPEIPGGAGAAVLFEREIDGPEGDEAGEWLDRLEAAAALTEESWFALAARDRERFRAFRHALPETVNERVRRAGFTKLASDYAVPLDRNLEMLDAYRRVLGAEFPGRYVVFGHIGDAHVHANILPESQRDFDRGRDVMTDLARYAVSLGGTVSAEHGLGKRKAHLLAIQYGAAEIDAMKAVKARLDQAWLLGRGTLFAV